MLKRTKNGQKTDTIRHKSGHQLRPKNTIYQKLIEKLNVIQEDLDKVKQWREISQKFEQIKN